MNKNATIIITGAAGFIGSCLVEYLNNKGFENLILVDDFSHDEKEINFNGKKYISKVERELFFDWLEVKKPPIEFIFHLGARTDTTEFNYSIHQHLNVDYSMKIWEYCTINAIPLVYASSAATYGDGKSGYNDDHLIVENLKPLNPYGISKNEFDKWVIQQDLQESNIKEHKNTPPFWAGLKFFNVYGPNEYHKGRMASVIFHAHRQIQENGMVKLFRSHREGFKDGEQLRDFIYVKDILKVCFWLMMYHQTIPSAIYNLGTGKARSFIDLVKATYATLGMDPNIEFINMPEDIRDKYQYFTEANMQKLKEAGYNEPYYSLEEGVTDYVKNFLAGRHTY